MSSAAPRSEKLEMRISTAHKQLLQSAAEATGARSVSDFVLTSAVARAEETLPDRQRFGLNADQWAAFQAALDAPPRPLPRLSKLLNEPSAFETPKVR